MSHEQPNHHQPLLANQQPPPPPAYYPYPQPGQALPNQPIAQPYNYYPPPQPIVPGQFLPPLSPCHFCQQNTNNYLKKIPGGVTWMWCLGLFIFTGICCCLPFCIDGCQDIQMLCANCHGVKGTWESSGCC